MDGQGFWNEDLRCRRPMEPVRRRRGRGDEPVWLSGRCTPGGGPGRNRGTTQLDCVVRNRRRPGEDPVGRPGLRGFILCRRRLGPQGPFVLSLAFPHSRRAAGQAASRFLTRPRDARRALRPSRAARDQKYGTPFKSWTFALALAGVGGVPVGGEPAGADARRSADGPDAGTARAATPWPPARRSRRRRGCTPCSLRLRPEDFGAAGGGRPGVRTTGRGPEIRSRSRFAGTKRCTRFPRRATLP